MGRERRQEGAAMAMTATDRLSRDFRVRLYGTLSGNSSFARVTAGMREGLEACGKYGGTVSIEDLDDEERMGGGLVGMPEETACAVYVGPPTGVGCMASWHQERWALLPANSSWMPSNLLRIMWPHVTGFLAPSRWAADVLRGYVGRIARDMGPRDVSVWPHGVGPEFVPYPDRYESRVAEYEDECFRVLHLASTRLERKGTAQLVEAWCMLLRDKRLPPRAELRLVLDEPPNWPEHVRRMAAEEPSIIHMDRAGATAHHASAMYQACHVVCQPSRGEGFGLVPLEARASGVPVVMTGCTGHAEHAFDARGVAAVGVHLVASHADAPIDDGPGAFAPEVRAEDVAETLGTVSKHWKILAEGAHEAAPFGKAWSWQDVTERWLKEER